MSAVSTKLMPASIARRVMRIDSAASVFPPNIIVPRRSETAHVGGAEGDVLHDVIVTTAGCRPEDEALK